MGDNVKSCKKKKKEEKQREPEDLGPFLKTRYTFKEQTPCPFCNKPEADGKLDVDMNPPFRDIIAVFDQTVQGLPCCSECRTAFLDRDKLNLWLPVWLGYPASILHRAGYQAKVHLWLDKYASAIEDLSTRRNALRKTMIVRAIKFMVISLVMAIAAACISTMSYLLATRYGGFWILAYGAVYAGIIGVFVGLWRLVKWLLAL